jgi:hypothetical protein
MKRKQITAWVLIGGAVVLLALWGYARTGWDHTVRLQLALQGLPFAELRDDPVGSRPDGNDHNLAYRRSVYFRGSYVGYIERFGHFIRPEDDPGNPYPMAIVLAIYQWGQYLAGIGLTIGAIVLLKSRKEERSQQEFEPYKK